MKLLLTSSGVNNEELTVALRQMAGESLEALRVAYIPTAMHPEGGDKRWVIKNLQECVDLKFKEIDIVDIAVLSKKDWLTRLEIADVIMIGGGYEGYLLRKMRESGLADELPRLLKDRIYVGISAGAMVTIPMFYPEIFEALYEEDQEYKDNIEALNFVNFGIIPHLNDDYFKNVREEKIKKLLKEQNATMPFYALPDGTAIGVIDGKVRKLGDGIVEVNK